MAQIRFLLDTNIILAIEDFSEVKEAFSELVRKCQEHRVPTFVHEISMEDISHDRDQRRRRIMLSKFEKFARIENVPIPSRAELEKRYGQFKRQNDYIDSILLYSVTDLLVADFLITEDIELHKAAAKEGRQNQVLRVREALVWINETFEPKSIILAKIEERICYQIDRSDPLFDSLREDYKEFDEWWNKCCRQHRKAWTIQADKKLAGLVVIKDEGSLEAPPSVPGKKVLKVSTFKVSEKFRGERIGEHFIKKITWFASLNKYDSIYLTAFPKQKFLVEILQEFGFDIAGRTDNGELIIYKSFLGQKDDLSPLNFHKKYYPLLPQNSARKFLIPIIPQYHEKLFPEATTLPELPLFEQLDAKGSILEREIRITANTIRKVYLCRTPTKSIQPGDILFFYLSKAQSIQNCQCITAIAVAEHTQETDRFDTLIQNVGRRSVYSIDELNNLLKQKTSPITIINFYLSAYSFPPVSLKDLLENKIIKAPPRSVLRIDETDFKRLITLVRFNNQ